MKLTNQQSAPVFSTHDTYGITLDLQRMKGQKIYLAFERNAGCPVCNLRMHELLEQAEAFKSSGVKMIFVYESPDDTLKSYLGENNYPFHFVADPQNKLYNLYGVERSGLKVLTSLLNGIMAKVQKGKKLFRQPMRQDGHMDRIPAEFIIDGSGKVQVAHYGRFIGDHLPIDVLLRNMRS